MLVHDDSYYESRRPTAKRPTLHNIQKTLWDAERRTVFHRNSTEWASITIFYLCFFGILFSLFSLQLWLTVYYAMNLGHPVVDEISDILKKDNFK